MVQSSDVRLITETALAAATEEIVGAIDEKANESTVTTALNNKADLIDGKVPLAQLGGVNDYSRAIKGSRHSVIVNGSTSVPANSARPSNRADIFFDWFTTEGTVPANMIAGDLWVNGTEGV